ncbi:alpha/beta fold hydrolase [Brevibacillus sp. SYSU BS000544]|uniref:alpha/beta fold hydrolase n=1 Tax=Brevibacillus sp. SYSU BS000544 TaxID=3416443 RepID=UPI003CE5B5B8
MKQIRLRDVAVMSYLDQGKGKPIVFIHAPLIGHVNFHFQLPLANEFRLIIPDLRGHGSSTPVRGELTMQTLADDLDELITLLELESFCLCGYSQGGSIVLDYLLRYPGKASCAILIGSFSEVSNLYLHSKFVIAQSLAALNGIHVLARSISSGHLEDSTLRTQWTRHAERTDPHTLHQLYLAGHHYHCTELLQQITVPVALLYGEKDDLMHQYARILEKNLQHPTLHMIPDVSHQIVTKKPVEFHSILRPFVEKNVSPTVKSPLPV